MSSFGQIPSSGNVSPKNTGRSSKAEIVKIIRLPEGLQNNARATRVEGTVTQSNNNGSVRIQTERGTIDVQFPQNGNDKAPVKGQRLEVSIPAGRPPRQANIHRANIQHAPSENVPQQPQARPLPRQGQSAPPNTAQQPQIAPTARPIPSAPLPPQNLPQAGQAPSTNRTSQQQSFPPTPLTEGINIRLVSLPPNQAIQIAQQSFSTLTIQNSLITNTAFTANLIAQNAVSQITQSALSISSNFQAQTTQDITPALLQQAQNNTLQTTIKTNVFQIVNTPINTNTINNALGSITTFQPNATITLAPLPNTVTANKIDVQILQINQASINLTAAATAGTDIQQAKIPALTQFAPPIISSNTATTITGQVTGITPQGQPLITLKLPNTPLPQSFILQYTPNNITIGSELKIAVQNIGLIPTQSSTAAQSPALTNMLQGFRWGAFDDAVQALLQSSPRLAASLIRTLPNAGNPAQLGASGVVVMAAIRSGDLSTWLGNKKIETLQRITKSGTLSRLTQDPAAPRAEASSNTDWKAVPLPMFWEGEIHKITLFMRQENQEQNQDNNNGGSTRFIFDLDLSRMGDVQLDGYLNDKRLDLIVRTQSGFSDPMQQMMRSSYSNAIKQADMSGDLTFQGHTNNWVHVLQENEQLGVSV